MTIRPYVVLCLAASTGCADLIGIEDRNLQEQIADETTLAGTDAAATDGSATASTSGTSTSAASGHGGDAPTAQGTGGDGGDGGTTPTAQGTGGGDGGGGSDGSGGEATGGGGGGAAPCSDDLTSDPLNCGECGHDCLGGDCETSVCQPVRITDPLPVAEYRSLVVDADADGEIFFVRWRPDAVVYRVDKEPGAVPEELHALEDGGWAFDVAIDHEWVYFTNYSDTFSDGVRGVYAQRRAGGAPIRLVRGDPSTSGVAYLRVEGPDLFFTTGFGGTAIGKTGLGGAPTLPIWSLGDAPPYYEMVSHLALDAEWVYSGSAHDGVWRYRRDGSGGEPVAAAVAGTDVYEAVDGFVYYTEGLEGGLIRRVAADGTGTVDTIDTNSRGFTIRNGSLYYISSDTKEVRRVPLEDPFAIPDILATTPEGIGSIAADDRSVFWMNYGTGEIYRRALPTYPPAPAVPLDWDCQAGWYADGTACDCGCGAPDPDCGEATATTYGCGAPHLLGDGVACASLGTCDLPPAWHCADLQFADGTVCNCECGAPDPDCDVGRLPVAGCAGSDFYCHEDTCIQTAPGAFCDSAHMGAADGCDCDCDAYDPDCDDPDQVIHGCGTQHAPGEGPACLGDGGCEIPLAWTCATAAYDDFSSCDCSCGALDPDCIVDRELPVAGCGADQRCPSDTCVDIAAGDTCETAIDLVEGEISGDFSTIVDDYDPGGACGLYGTPGRDVSFRLTLAAGETATIVVDPSNWVDVAAYLVSSCDDVVAACVTGADENWLGDPETLSFTAVEATTLFLIVDQYGGPLDGTFTVTLDLGP